jgi:hypothetical protein
MTGPTVTESRWAQLGLESRLAAAWESLGANRRRAIRHGLSIVGLISIPYIVVLNATNSMFGFDAYAYWAIDLRHLYGESLGNTSDLGAFRYTPAIGQLFAIFHAIPWELFLVLWVAAMAAALVWLNRRNWLIALAFPPVALEIFHGNVHLFMAVAIALGFRYPATWAFVVLTKVSPGVGALWFLFRGEYRKAAIAVGVTGAIAAVSFVVAPDLWRQYTQTMIDNLAYDPGHPYPVPIPLPIRMAAGAALVAWGARTDRPWTVPVAATLALPIIWFHGLAVLLAIVPIERERRRAAAAVTTPGDRRAAAAASGRPAPAG